VSGSELMGIWLLVNSPDILHFCMSVLDTVGIGGFASFLHYRVPPWANFPVNNSKRCAHKVFYYVLCKE
jgi:hypothetical protein